MATKSDRKGAEKSQGEGQGSNSANVKDAISDVVGIIRGQVKKLEETAKQDEPLAFEDARLLGMYARALVAISSDERHQASIITHDLGMVSNEELDALEEEARKVLGKK
jgi:hypothetical protein